MTIRLNVNNEKQTLNVDPEKPLLWVLREDLDLTGAKYGCGAGLCGACTVHVDGVAVRSCVTPVASCIGSEITTIEGLSADGEHPLQRAWVEGNVMQCGYCQPGQLMNAAALLSKNPQPSVEQIRSVMQGNICRCGTYPRIEAAIKKVAGENIENASESE
ncbi:MAG: (2Fe-2S)-binding protein [Gammaproteobacteria bacterium]|nr:(2Fe-2S)-binding protein [Gammaproteobacteria bacterium]